MIDIFSVIRYLRPNDSFSISGNDLQTLRWHTYTKPPSKSEIEETISRFIGFSYIPTHSDLKLETSKRILDKCPYYKQHNMTARLLGLSMKENLTEDELEEKQSLQAALGWIEAMRAHSNALEAHLDAGTLRYDWQTNEDLWPHA